MNENSLHLTYLSSYGKLILIIFIIMKFGIFILLIVGVLSV